MTGWVGTISGICGVCIFALVSFYLLPLLGVDLDGPVEVADSRVLGGVLFLMILLLSFVIGVMLGVGTFSFFMVLQGKFTRKEAKEYLLYSKYPSYWYLSQYSFLAERRNKS